MTSPAVGFELHGRPGPGVGRGRPVPRAGGCGDPVAPLMIRAGPAVQVPDNRLGGGCVTTMAPQSKRGVESVHREARVRDRAQRFLRRWRYGYIGLAGATIFFCLSATPSLLPRGWLFQGVISGLLAALGYGLGVLTGAVARLVLGRQRLPAPSRTAWRVLAVTATVLIVLFCWWGSAWQRDIHRLMGMPAPPRGGYVIVILIAVPVFAALVGLVRLLRGAGGRLASFLGRWIPTTAARAVSVVVVLALAIGVANGVVLRGLFRVADSSFATINGETQPDVRTPTSSSRSGGPGSLVTWSSLGNQGPRFV